ncbi:MAG: hypothetical protein RMK00_06545 [Bacteroidota bacterium]|nr:hypothetical protein [Bacteroidota bacterium]
MHGYVLTLCRYVGTEIKEDDAEPFAEKMQRLVAKRRRQQAEGLKLCGGIVDTLSGFRYGG